MKKILIIIPNVPFPLNSGGNQAFYHMVDYLRSRLSVSVLCYAWSTAEKERIKELEERWSDVTFYCFQHPHPHVAEDPLVKHPLYYRCLKKIKNSIERKMRRQILQQTILPTTVIQGDLTRECSTLSLSIFRELHPAYVAYVAQVASLGFDLIQVEFYELIALGYILPRNVPSIFVHHELRYVRNGNELSLFIEHHPDDDMLFRVSRDFERMALQTYRHVIALTEVDRALLVDFLGREDRIYASPAVVQMHSTYHSFVPAVSRRFTFVGYGGHYPNLDAVVWFCKEVAPCLRRKGYSFTFQVIGMGYEHYATALQKLCPEVSFLGYVERLDSVVQGSISVVPIRIGSGMRMKIMDIITLGVPLVTTSKGLEGIQLKNGEECLVADSAEAFAEAICRLSESENLQQHLLEKAQARLKELYNPQQMLLKRWKVYEHILNTVL